MRQLQSLQLENRQAVVARVAELITDKGGQQALMEIRGQQLKVVLPANAPELKAGDLVRIMREGQTLNLLDKLPAPADARLTQALIRHLPWQQHLDNGLSQLLNALTTGLRAPPGGLQPGASEPLPAAVREALQAIARILPAQGGSTSANTGQSGEGSRGTSEAGQKGLDAARIREWLSNSGTLTEAKLARGAEPAVSDLKLALGRLALSLLQHQGVTPEQFTRFTPLPSQELVNSPLQFPAANTPPVSTPAREAASPGQMLRLLAGMLNRITVNQLHSQLLTTRATAEAPAPVNTLITDLPWLAPGGEVRTAQLKIDYEKPDRETGTDTQRAGVAEWRFSLAMDLDDAGRVFFDVALRQQSVSARVWADRQDTVRRVNRQLGLLRTSLSELGLEVAELECRRGHPPTATTKLEHRLVDTRA